MNRWDYVVIDTFGAEALRDELERYGAAGWELVSVAPNYKKIGPTSLVAVLKRPGVGQVADDPVNAATAYG